MFIFVLKTVMSIKTIKLPGEIWHDFPIRGYPGYMISSLGRVYSRYKGDVMIQAKNKKGYPKISVRYMGKTKSFLTHRLVSFAFIPNTNKYPQVNHKDGVKANSCVNNLEWCTQSMNKRHAFAIGLESNQGQNHPMAILKTQDVLSIRNLFKNGYTRRMLSEKFGVKPTTIKSIILRQSWSHI